MNLSILGVTYIALASWALAASEIDPQGPEAQAKSLQSWRQKIVEAPSLPSDEAIPLLAECVNKTSMYSIFQSDERWEVHYAAQKALIAIPGHAEFYEKRIKEAQKKVESLEGWAQGKAKSELMEEQMYGFEKLSLMPSPETVRVLGDFLSDPWGLLPNAKSGGDYSNDAKGFAPHASQALVAIAKLPLEVRPSQTPPDQTRYWEDIDAWKLWYEQVKAGTRTFRFKGDPQEYSLAGPVIETREPKDPRPAADTEINSAPPAEAVATTVGVPIWALGLAGGLLAVALWFAMRRRPAAS